MRLVEEHNAHLEKYIDEGKPTSPQENIYLNALFTYNVVANSATKRDKMDLGAM